MKKAALYAPRVRRLLRKLKREGRKVSLPVVEDPMEQLLRGILSNYASEQRASTAVSKLRAAVVDLNELRVTPVSEIVETIGADYPQCRAAAEEISRALNSVFNRTHRVDLDFLKTGSRKAAETFLYSLDGLSPHAAATVILRSLQGHAIPVDVNMLSFLRKSDIVPEDAPVEQVQRFLAKWIKERDAVPFYVLLKRYAATHVPRKPAKVGATAAGAARKKSAKRAVKKAARKTSGKTAARSKKKTTSSRARAARPSRKARRASRR